MRYLLAIAGCLLLFASAALADDRKVMMHADTTYTLEGGKQVTLKKGQVVTAERIEGYFYVISLNDEEELMVSGDEASEMHRRYQDRDVEARFIAISNELRALKVLPTNERVTAVLNKELTSANRDIAIRELAESVRKLDVETARLRRAAEDLERVKAGK